MSERRFEQSVTAKKAVEQDIIDSGAHESDEEFESAGLESEVVFDIDYFNKLFLYLGEEKALDQQKISEFGKLTDGLERLKYLQTLSVTEAFESIRNFGLNTRAFDYLVRRMEFYQKFITEGKVSEWGHEAATPETVRVGIQRDIYYAAMQGTPEMGAVKIATNRINEGIEEKEPTGENTDTLKKVKSVVEFWGYYSGIQEGSLGLYPDLGELYKNCKEKIVSNSARAGKDLDPKELEHQAVLLMADRLENSFEYNGKMDISNRSYRADFKEAIVVGRLGSEVMRQMKGMRGKIQETNFKNVERFIGKSGNNPYQGEKFRLDKDVKVLEDFIQVERGDEPAEQMTNQKNNEAVKRVGLWFKKEKEKIDHWLEKSNTKIASYDIDDEERNSIYVSVQDRYDKQVVDLQQKYQEEIDRLENRTSNILLKELKDRQVIVDRRFEKRKSLAQKALDLHFHFNHWDSQKAKDKKISKIQLDIENKAQILDMVQLEIQKQSSEFPEMYEKSIPYNKVLDAYFVRFKSELEERYQEKKRTQGGRLKIMFHNLLQANAGVEKEDIVKGQSDKLEKWYDAEKKKLFTRHGQILEQYLYLQNERTRLLAEIESKKQIVEHANDYVAESYGDKTTKPFEKLVDWVNRAPFGTIKRAHRALNKGVDDQTVMMRALAEVNGESVTNQNPEEFILNIIKSGKADLVIRNFEKYSGIAKDQQLSILLAIIKAGSGRQVGRYLDKFTGVVPGDHLQIVETMNSADDGYYVFDDFKKFSGIKPEDKKAVLLAAIRAGGGYKFAQNIEEYNDIFTEKDHKDIAMEMIKEGFGDHLRDILDKFTGLDGGLKQIIKSGNYKFLPQVLEAGFLIEEITRFPFLISPLVAKK